MAFENYALLPGIQADQETFENQFWWGEEKHQVWSQAPLDGAARDTGNTGKTTVLRAGLLLGRVTSTSKIKQWDATATDGTENIWGILHTTVNTQRLSADADRLLGRIMVGGLAKASRIIIPGQTSPGLSGVASEHDVRSQLAHRILFDDNFYIPAPSYNRIVAKTTDYTVLEGDNGTLFTTTGAAGAVNFTLPATAEKGLRYRFMNTVDQNLTVTAGTADTMVAFNDAAADSVALSTASEKIGGGFEVIGDGSKWVVMPILGQDSQTVTVAT